MLPPLFHTHKSAAARLGCSLTQLRRLKRLGKLLPRATPGGGTGYAEADLVRYVESLPTVGGACVLSAPAAVVKTEAPRELSAETKASLAEIRKAAGL